jgi:hypothetical protein
MLVDLLSLMRPTCVAPKYFSARLIFAGSCHGLSSRGARACSPPSAAAELERQPPIATLLPAPVHAGRERAALPVQAAVRVSSCV